MPGQRVSVHSPRPGGTFPLLCLAFALQSGGFQLRLQWRNSCHQFLQFPAGLGSWANPLGVRHPAFVLFHSAGGRRRLEGPIYLESEQNNFMKGIIVKLKWPLKRPVSDVELVNAAITLRGVRSRLEA